MNEQIIGIKARLQAATANGKHWISGVATFQAKDGRYVSYSCGPDRVFIDMKDSIAEADKDDALILNAPADIAYLLAELEDAHRQMGELKAKLDAVPMAALLYRLANSEQSPECWADWDNRGEAYEKATNEIDAWLKRRTTQ